MDQREAFDGIYERVTRTVRDDVAIALVAAMHPAPPSVPRSTVLAFGHQLIEIVGRRT